MPVHSINHWKLNCWQDLRIPTRKRHDEAEKGLVCQSAADGKGSEFEDNTRLS